MIKDCYNSDKWQRRKITVDSAWRPDFIKDGAGVMEQMVTISDKSGQYVIVNRSMAEEGFVDLDDEGKEQEWRLRCKNGILQGWNQEPAVLGKTKQYRDYYGKGQENDKH